MQKKILISVVGGLLAIGTAGTVFAQNNLFKQPIRLVVPYAVGGGTDFFARLVAPGMGAELGQTVIVENKPGASGIIAATMVANQPLEKGSTILLGDMTTYAVNSSMFENIQYDVKSNLTPVTMTAKFDFLLVVNPAVLPVKNVEELLETAKKTPTGLSYGSPGIGTTHHLAMEMFAKQTGANLVPINYKGGGPAIQDLISGQVSLMFLDRASALPHIESGRLRSIAVAGSKRIAAFPDVPTIAESGVEGFDVEGWQGFTVRAGTPEPVIKAISEAYATTIASPEIASRLAQAGIDPVAGTPEQFSAYIEEETVRWRDVIQSRGIKAE